MEDANTPAANAPVAQAKPAQAKTAARRSGAAVPSRKRPLRHFILLASFLIWVLAPVGAAAVYLYTVAQDQYASHVGFSVRKEEMGSAIEILGGITELSGSSSSDTDILYEFIQSQQLVRIVNQQLDLPTLFQRAGDPVFSLGDDTRIEALSRYWKRMVKVYYDRGSGLIEVRVLAFDAENAQQIAKTVFAESSRMINDLSAIARNDATRYARQELDTALDRLKRARTAQTAFRARTGIIDPSADVQGQMGLLNSLQAKLADAIIERELLLDTTTPNDPRVTQAARKIDVIRHQIEEERARFGGAGPDSGAFSRLLEEYQGILVDAEFAEKSYVSAQAAYDAALAEAQRQSRYLASHIEPTLAETALYPQRSVILLVLATFLLISWSIMAMLYYAIRDRR